MVPRILRATEAFFFFILLAASLGGSNRIHTSLVDEVHPLVAEATFDYVTWTLQALEVKLGQAMLASPFYFAEPERHGLVLDYLELVGQIEQAEARLSMIYSDPGITDPTAAGSSLQAELDRLIGRQNRLAPLAEAVLQAQITSLLADSGLATGGQPVPPVLARITPLPFNLIVSPRTVIQQDASISLASGLGVAQMEQIESQVEARLDVSALVVPVGGIGAYPTMIARTTMLDWLVETIAHEWIHNYLTLHPLGMNYDTSPQLRTMNETAASIGGAELARAVLARYYPERLQAAGLFETNLAASQPDPNNILPPFDFRAEMHATRIQADTLLAAGLVEEAEVYMEARRAVFWENGYPIRRLNQAYFAFYGAYADVPGGAAGEDPVGPAVRALRARSSSLGAFLQRIARMSSFEELQAAVAP